MQRKNNIPYAYYGHLNYKQGRCKAKDTRVLYIDNWIKQIVVSDFLSQKDLSERTKDINRQILEERQRVQQDIKEIKQKMIIILSDKAKQLVRITSQSLL